MPNTKLDYMGLPFVDAQERIRPKDMSDLNDLSGLELSELLYLDNPLPEFDAAVEHMLLAVIHHDHAGISLWQAADRLRSAMFAQQAQITGRHHND